MILTRIRNRLFKAQTPIKESFQPRYVIAFVLIVAYLASVAFTTQGLSLFNPGGVTYMTDLEFYLMVGICTVLGVGLFVFANKQFKIKVRLPLLVICLVLLVIDIIAIKLFPDEINNPDYGVLWTYRVQPAERTRYIFGWFVGDMALYLFCGVIPYLFRSHKTVDFWLWVGVGVGILLIVCSLVIEWDWWKALLTGHPLGWRPKSITNYQNTFAFAVLWSWMCALILYGKHRTYVGFIGMLLLSAIIIVLQVRTCVGAAGIAAILAVIWLVISGWKKRRGRQIVLLSGVGAFILLLVFVAFVPLPAITNLGAMIKNLAHSMFTFSGGTMTGRTDIWKAVLYNTVKHPTIFLFGTGDGIFEWYVTASAGVAEPGITYGFPVHNGFLYVFGRFGVVGLLVYIFGLAYIFKDIHHAVKVRGDKWMVVVGVALICYLIHSIGEDDALLDMRLKGMMGLGIVWWPLAVSKRDWLRKQSLLPVPEKIEIADRKSITPTDVLKFAYAISMLLLVCFVGLAPYYKTIFGSCFYNNKYTLIGLTITLLVAPLLFAEVRMQHKEGNALHFWVHLSLSSVIVIWAFVLGLTSNSMFYPIAISVSLVFLLLEGAIGANLRELKFKEFIPLFVKVLIGLASVCLAHALHGNLDEALITRTTTVIILIVYLSLNALGLCFYDKPRSWIGCLDLLAARTEVIYEKVAQRQLDRFEKKVTSIY